jgi:hypothetical protein
MIAPAESCLGSAASVKLYQDYERYLRGER